MPHIVVESTAGLLSRLDFVQIMHTIHIDLAATGHAQLGDFKSRVHACHAALAGNDPNAEFVIARLITTNPRPREVQRQMAQIIHDRLVAAINAFDSPFWWQCCVFIESAERSSYLKTDSRQQSGLTFNAAPIS
ncbi:5-carboxymethyl-2-hydroxymuconate Delta-isomerase [Pseudomonas gingeri]